VSGRTILVVDDTPQTVRLLEAMLTPQGYTVLAASSGKEALGLVGTRPIDLVLLDILMPDMDGYEVCRRLREDPGTVALPVVMITSMGDQEKLRALEAGADDFIPKPFDRAELLARVKSLLRIKEYYDSAQRTAAELVELNRTLEGRVAEQVEEIERLARLRRFLSPPLADLIVASGDEGNALRSHRREIAVLFCDLRGFTAFAESSEPEEVMVVLRQFHDLIGGVIHSLEATVGYFAGDGLMVFFNDPLPCSEPARQAVRMAVTMRSQMAGLIEAWRRKGHNLDFGVGITLGYATLGEIGFEGRSDYGAIGTVVNLASRLCDEAKGGQILLSQPGYAALDDVLQAERLPDFTLKGFARPVPAYDVVRLIEPGEQGAARDGQSGALTPQEVRVLQLVAAGRTSREIGMELDIAARTVERHISNLYLKIDAHNKADATAYAIKHGIYDPSGG
jgi:class 3 adenylate cyclase/CheY-like chemotaxis protein